MSSQSEQPKQSKAKTGKVGDLLEVSEGSEVTFPDGIRRVIAGGVVVLDQKGTFVVDGAEVEVR